MIVALNPVDAHEGLICRWDVQTLAGAIRLKADITFVNFLQVLFYFDSWLGICDHDRIGFIHVLPVM